ncbi:YdeI/OmpD-associated family protein [Streptomyces sp. NPDC096323]|uniref:YdeI/OmpD-associated family protein n=1 Tax=Streptomyces sp. NPDC096323 TaxID=3155822 RepID=UPI00331D5006
MPDPQDTPHLPDTPENARPFAGAAELESWLEKHHTERTGIWLKIAKRHSGVQSVSAAEVIDSVLCFGWIDGQRKSFDEVYYLQRITPRRRRSPWSLINVEKVGALTEAGRMRAAGLAEVELARADGRWESAYPSQSRATVPADLAAALEANEPARLFYEGLGRSDRYLVLLRLMTATTPEVRAGRLQKAVASLAAGRKIR